ncbi:hypothetical protein OAT84_00425 [Gammaproteobacteria bacterium]|nr:hypothetical protein [Gammaproteobacteria bacterium]
MSLEYSDLQSFSAFIRKIRLFFYQRQITEVFTNPLMQRRVPDMGVDMLKVATQHQQYYLHSSPEWEMKKLLSEQSGDIYQLVHVFRDDPIAKWHKPAFLMLEWYQVGIDEQALINVCCELLTHLGYTGQINHHHVPVLFQQYCQIDVYQTSLGALEAYCMKHGLSFDGLSRSDEITSWLDLIWVNHIEPIFDKGLHIVDRYLPEQSALANVVMQPYPHAQRFEIYLDGCEIANGYHELTDTDKMQGRLIQLTNRMGLETKDVVDFSDIKHMPACSGVSFGIERLYGLITEHLDLEK